MNERSQIRQSLPFGNRTETLVQDHTVPDIIRVMRQQHKENAPDYDYIAKMFWKGNAGNTAKYLFDFCKKNVKYKVEPGVLQSTKTPGAIIAQGYGDCKHYASFITGVCDSLNRSGYPVQAKYRFVADNPGIQVHHVFAVVSDGSNEYWTDPVLSFFNQRPNYATVKDLPMAIVKISGTDTRGSHPLEAHRQRVLAFLASRGKTPADFVSPEHLMHFLQHPDHPVHQIDGVGNFFKDIAKGFKTNVANIKKGYETNVKNIAKGVKVNTANIAHGMKVNAANAAKEIKKFTLKVSLSAARGSFLGLVAINAFNLAHRLHDSMLTDKRAGLLRTWRDMGGDEKRLINTINNGYKVYQQHHGGVKADYQIHGVGAVYVEGLGVVQAAALLALATAIIAAVSKFLKPSPQDDANMASAAKQGAEDLTSSAGAGILSANGELGPEAAKALATMTDSAGMPTMNVSTGTSDDGSPELTVHDVSHPLIDNAGTDDGSGNSITDVFNGGLSKLQDFWEEHHKAIIIGTVVVGAGIIIVPRLTHKKRRRR